MHTKEPWHVGSPPPNSEQTIGDPSGLMVAVTTTGSGVNSKENARRIVACVNACAGIETEVLERHALGVASAEFSMMKQQRDELLAALKVIIRGVPDTWDGVKNAQAVIAKCES